MSLVPGKNGDNCGTTECRTSTFKRYDIYKNLKRLLDKHDISDKDALLVWGCGDPELSADLYSDGCTDVTSVDVNESAKANATKLNRDRFPELVYEVRDVTSNTRYPDEKFNVVIDKGTLDAVMSDDGAESPKRATAAFNEIGRILKCGGRYVCVSLLRRHVAKCLFSHFGESGWTIRVSLCTEVERSADFDSRPVFVVVCAKPKGTPEAQPVLKWRSEGLTDKTVESVDDLLDTVVDTQRSVSLCFDFTKSGLLLEEPMSEDFEFEVNCSETKKPRYTIKIVESFAKKNPDKMTFSGFVVPNGQEHEWLFNDAEGKEELRRQCNVDRLAIISMHRGQVYGSLKRVNRELSRIMLKVAPQGVIQRKDPILFLSLEQRLGERKTVVECTSELSGSYVIEDVLNKHNETVRRLVFLDMPALIQSETRLLTENGKTKIDYSYFNSDYLLYMGLGVGIIANQSNNARRVLLIGLGGGTLTNMFINVFTKVHTVAVEIDLDVYKTAKEYFGLIEDSRLEVKICDGLDYLREAVKNGDRYDAVLYDIDVKDATLGLCGPPVAFLSQNILSNVKLLIGNNGIFVINFGCRSSDTRNEMLGVLKTNFKQITALNPPGLFNRVLIARNNDEAIDGHLLEQTAMYMNQCAKSSPLVACDIIDVFKLKENIEKIM